MNNAPELAALLWSFERLPAALASTARALGIDATLDPAVIAACDGAQVERDPARWIGALGAAGTLEVERVECRRDALADMLAGAGPAVLVVASGNERGLLVLCAGGRRTVTVMDAHERVRRMPVQALAAMLNATVLDDDDSAALLARAGIAGRRATRARAALTATRLAELTFDDCWLVRPPATRSVWSALRAAHMPRRVVVLGVVFALLYGCEIAGWRVLGAGALDGRLEPGWLLAWTLLLFTMAPLEVAGRALEARIALAAGVLIKQRVLAGALALDPDSTRREGAGHLLARVLEAQTFESLLLDGGFGAALATLELSLCAWILAQSGEGQSLLTALAVAVVLAAVLTWRYARHLERWTAARFTLTHDLAERLGGHRTRQVQEPSVRRHLDEDLQFERYLDVARNCDAAALPLFGALPRAWLVAACVALLPTALAGTTTPAMLGIALGGILLGYRAFGSLSGGLGALLRARIAWRQVAVFFAAGTDEQRRQPLLPALPARRGDRVLELHDVGYAYAGATQSALGGASVTIARGDRVLIEGPSGGGKSTLAALIAGWRRPASGLMLLRGLDRASLGASWRQLATAAPQFHENHILSGTLAFNLLMGRSWPASNADLREAERVCDALGLGALLDRMPSGLMQMVGETGWQLSHGERSRVFLARALLQRAEVVVLDESFAALDPPTLAQCLRFAMEEAPTLAVVAHP